ncbi:MAG: alpha/beta hydrolase [Alphaproteobacteria bacterium]|nr:alpha/beta hydrolase [Alphaproteobacteria bacterium]MBL7099373.1 alpha/beta hydrolase [Alphaproteobacteria bacterium]
MPLDPIVKGFLDQMKAMGGPKMSEVGAPAGREQFNALMQLVGPKDVAIGKVQNLTVPGKGGPIPIRVYTPVAAGRESMPALIYFHGGGWVIGNIDSHDGLCRLMANEGGFRVIAVEYRLGPEHKYPAAYDDAISALTWIASNAAGIGVDANQLAVGGDSAGGCLAAVCAQYAKAKGIPLDAQMLFFPVTQIGEQTASLKEFAVGYFLEKETLDWFYDCYLPAGADKNDPKISPLRAKDLSGLAPAYIMLGGFDPLHDEGMQYADKLRAAGVKVTVADYSDMVHTFIYLQSVLPQAHEALASAAKAVAKMFTE